MLDIKKILLQITMTITTLLLLSACGGSKESTPDPINAPIDNSLKVFSEFEGRSVTLISTLESVSYQWEQVSGPTLDMGSMSDKEITLTIPWVEDSETAEITVTATIDGQSVIQPVNLEILNRRYIVMNVDDNIGRNLYLNYISVNDEEGVPDLATLQLTNVLEQERVCGYFMSPNGQYVAYTIGKGEMLPSETCSGITIVDIETLESQVITPLNRDNELVKVRSISWSKDSSKIAYEGDHGEDIFQLYVAQVPTNSATGNSVSYVNYGNSSVSIDIWPTEDQHPVFDGGNPFDLQLINNIDVDQIRWLDNNEGLSFKVYDNEDNEYFPYLGSVHGETLKLERNNQVFEELYELDSDNIDEQFEICADAPPNHYCAFVGFGPPSLTPIERSFVNPNWFGSSVDGHLAFTTTMVSSNTAPTQVLVVRRPIIEENQIFLYSPIEATHVLDAAWSPTEPHLAFASTSEYRHVHQPVETFEEGKRLMQREIPGQLYYYRDWELGHQAGQERLSRPRIDIDSNPVRKFQWSNNGKFIGYARGEQAEVSFGYFTSLWATELDEIHDENSATIDANTVLLDATEGNNTYYTDFKWSPNNDGVLTMFQSEGGTTLKYFRRDGSFSFESPFIQVFTTGSLWSINASFSPSGDYFAYIDKVPLNSVDSIAAILVYDTTTGERIQIETPNLDASGIIFPSIQWSPHGDAIIYSTRPFTSSSREYYLAKIDNTHENLNIFLLEGNQIKQVKVDNHSIEQAFPFSLP